MGSQMMGWDGRDQATSNWITPITIKGPTLGRVQAARKSRHL